MKPNGEPDKMDAIRSLYPNVGCTLRNGVIVVWQSDQPQPTEKQIQAKLAELQTQYDSKQYQRDRAVAYPSIQDQLDMQYHDQVDGTTTWKDAIAKVKSDNPKPT